MTHAVRVWQRNALVYRRTWRGSIFFSFLTPLLYLTAMGIGLGAYMTDQSRGLLGGVDYLHFLGPGLLAATCMQTATFESTFPILSKIMWRRNYEAMLSTPLAVRHLLVGELGWVAFRVFSIAAIFLLVMTGFGIPRSPLAILAVGSAVLTGLAFSAAVIAFTATQKNDSGFAALFRFVVNPLFLFSGTFFPVDRLPDAVEWLAALTPLYHGVALTRGFILDQIDPLGLAIHAGYLLVFFTLASALALRLLRRRLEK